MSGSRVMCPRCSQETTIGMVFENVRFQDNGAGNISVRCGNCGLGFDAAPGRQVTVSTIGGRLRWAMQGARLLAEEGSQNPDKFGRLLKVLEEEKDRASSTAQIADAIEEATAGSFSAFTNWLKANEAYAQWIGLLFIIAQLLGFGSTPSAPPDVNVTVNVTPSEDELKRLVDKAVRQLEEGRKPTPLRARRAGRSPARNEACPCGSGVKFKKCCGRPGARP